MTPDQWLMQNTFYCPDLQARLTPEQCSINRSRATAGRGAYWLPKVEQVPRVCAQCGQYAKRQEGINMQKKCNLCRKDVDASLFRVSEQTGKPVVTCAFCEKRYSLGPWRHDPDQSVGEVLGFDVPEETVQPPAQPQPADITDNPETPKGRDNISYIHVATGNNPLPVTNITGSTPSPSASDDTLSGLEDFQVHTPGRRGTGAQYASVFSNRTVALSAPLRSLFPPSLRYAVVGYNSRFRQLRFKLLSAVHPKAHKMHGKERNVCCQGALQEWGLLDAVGRKFEADYDPDLQVVTIYLDHEYTQDQQAGS